MSPNATQGYNNKKCFLASLGTVIIRVRVRVLLLISIPLLFCFLAAIHQL